MKSPFKKQMVGVLAALMVTAGLVSTAWASEEKVLTISNWSDYIAPEIIKHFEKVTCIKILYDLFYRYELLNDKLIA